MLTKQKSGLNLQGQEVLETGIEKGKKVVCISLSDLAAGSYIYKISDATTQQIRQSGKLVIK